MRTSPTRYPVSLFLSGNYAICYRALRHYGAAGGWSDLVFNEQLVIRGLRHIQLLSCLTTRAHFDALQRAIGAELAAHDVGRYNSLRIVEYVEHQFQTTASGERSIAELVQHFKLSRDDRERIGNYVFLTGLECYKESTLRAIHVVQHSHLQDVRDSLYPYRRCCRLAN